MVRIIQNLLYPHVLLWLTFSKQKRSAIANAVKKAEEGHAAQIHICVEARLPFKHLFKHFSARDRATDLFSDRILSKTKQNTGILIYVLMAEHKIEILADKGIPLDQKYWMKLADIFEVHARRRDFEEAFSALLVDLSCELKKVLPARSAEESENEIPDEIEIM